MGNPTRYPAGLSVFSKPGAFANYPVPSHLRIQEYMDDFNNLALTALGYTQTVGTGATAYVDGNGGILSMATGAVNAEITHMRKIPATMLFVPGTAMWFSINLQVNDNISGFIAGLQAGGTAFAPTDGVFFRKLSGSANVDLVLSKASVLTTLSAITTIAPNVATTFSFYYDGAGSPTLWAYSSTPQPAPVAFGQYIQMGGTMVASTQTFTNLPIVPVAPSFGIQAGAAAIKTMLVDYILAGSEMLRP